MGEAYFNLKLKLEDLGYNNTLPIDAVPLVECVLADLLQTTRSLQHYMDLSKEALMQRDSLMLGAEPYKCDNAKLIQENNQLHKDIMQLKEENLRISKECRRKIKSLSEGLVKKDAIISKLQHDVRDLSLKGLCADTQSSRNKSRRKDTDVCVPKVCICNDKKISNDKDVTELTLKIQSMEEKIDTYCDEILLLKDKVEHRDNEIIRLNMLLEGGRPLTAISRDCCTIHSDNKVQNLIREVQELELINNNLKKEIEKGLEKQHEAMLRALSLADKNKCLQEELQKVDALALKVEDDCNKRLAVLMNDINFLQTKVEHLSKRNIELEHELRHKDQEYSPTSKLQETLNTTLKENDALNKEIKDLLDHNKTLQEKVLSLSHLSLSRSYQFSDECEHTRDKQKCPTREELRVILQDERQKYEKYIKDIQDKMNETIYSFNKNISKTKEKDSPSIHSTYDSGFVRDLHAKLCESEQKILMLRKENDDLKNSITKHDVNNKQNYKDVISQLNAENVELSKENILLSQQISQYRAGLNSAKHTSKDDHSKKDVHKLKNKIEELTHEIDLLKKDKHEYNLRYKDTLDLNEKLKRDLVYKQKEIEHLEEENCSYKMTSRNGKASTDQLKDECNFLREQIKRIQTDVIKEKTLASQIKNIQLETERSSNEIQNELLTVQKKLSLSRDTIESLERKCKELQSEINTIKSDKSSLIDNIRKIDQERDKLVIELDHKTENICVLEQKIKSQTYDMNKFENELTELKRKFNINKISEHKIMDYEAQLAYLNGEILRLTQQYDTAIIENKHLQNSLADANGVLKITKIEFDKSRKEVEGLKQQLQHYVAEIRRIEELLSQKEAERSDMLEHFASLSVEANILENTNHSLESESASKSQQLQSYIIKIQTLEGNLLDKDSLIDSQSTRIASMTCKITALENEVKLLAEEKSILEQNNAYLKKMCSNLQCEKSGTVRGLGDTDSELKLYENRIKSLSCAKADLEVQKDEMKEKAMTTEKLLANARREIVDLKLALQDATSETKSLQESVSRLRRDSEMHEPSLSKEDEFDLPLMLDEIREASHEDDDDSAQCRVIHKRFSKYTHSDTL